jgi:hypothetical protein
MNYCSAPMSAPGNPVGYALFCNAEKGHQGPHCHTFPGTVTASTSQQPSTEMTSLKEIKAKLEGLHNAIAMLSEQMDKMYQVVGANHTHIADLGVKLDGLREDENLVIGKIGVHGGMLAGLDGKVQAIGGVLVELLAKPKAKRRRK